MTAHVFSLIKKREKGNFISRYIESVWLNLKKIPSQNHDKPKLKLAKIKAYQS